jgi:hypothetical protein
MADHGNEKRRDSTVEPASSQTATLAVIGEETNIISETPNRDEKTLSDFGADNRTPNDDNAPYEGEGDAESVDSKDELKLSKARCIALVCTVTGASFLNVSLPTQWKIYMSLTLSRPFLVKVWSLSFPKLVELSMFLTRDYNGSSHLMS